MENNRSSESFIDKWNDKFPDHPLTTADLKVPQALMGAIFKLFGRLDIDADAVLAPPDEPLNEHTIYYWDLIPGINISRVVKHLVCVTPTADPIIRISYFLQPTVVTSRSVLFCLFNLMIFNEERLIDIEPREQELFSKSKQVNILEKRKNKLLELLNEQAVEKGKRADRIEKFHVQIKTFEEELKQENDDLAVEKLELEEALKEKHQSETVINQRKTQRDAVVDEIEKKKALIVHDADDIRAQASKAAQDVQDADEKLNALLSSLMLKENNLKNLQTIKPNFDVANNCLNEMLKIMDSLKDYENGDFDADSAEGELYVLNTEISELESQYAELKMAREDAARKLKENQAKRQQEKELAERNLHEAEKKDKKCQEQSKKAIQEISSIKEMTLKYEEEKTSCMEELRVIKEDFETKVKNMEETLFTVLSDAEKTIIEKLKKYNERA